MRDDFNNTASSPAAKSKGRGLTSGEIEIAKTIFGSSIDYSKVRVHSGPYTKFQSTDTIVTPNGHLYCGGLYSDDFSAGDRSLFIHEMTHVWQYQNNVLNPRIAALTAWARAGFNYDGAYHYTLDPAKDLLDYNLEQQAAMVADYFEGLRMPESVRSQRDADRFQVMQKFIANPSYAFRFTVKDAVLTAASSIVAPTLPRIP
jgi:hypothetical protein